MIETIREIAKLWGEMLAESEKHIDDTGLAATARVHDLVREQHRRHAVRDHHDRRGRGPGEAIRRPTPCSAGRCRAGAGRA